MPDMRDVVIFNQRFYTNVYNVVNIYLLSFIYLIFHGFVVLFTNQFDRSLCFRSEVIPFKLVFGLNWYMYHIALVSIIKKSNSCLPFSILYKAPVAKYIKSMWNFSVSFFFISAIWCHFRSWCNCRLFESKKMIWNYH